MQKLLLLLSMLYCFKASAHDHAKHNMLLFGEREIYASHLVYKQPHNFQVILKVELNEADRQAYLAARRAHPKALIRFLLDPLDISQIDAQNLISGPVYLDEENNEAQLLIPSMAIPRSRYSVLYLDELPLSLKAGH